MVGDNLMDSLLPLPQARTEWTKSCTPQNTECKLRGMVPQARTHRNIIWRKFDMSCWNGGRDPHILNLDIMWRRVAFPITARPHCTERMLNKN